MWAMGGSRRAGRQAGSRQARAPPGCHRPPDLLRAPLGLEFQKHLLQPAAARAPATQAPPPAVGVGQARGCSVCRQAAGAGPGTGVARPTAAGTRHGERSCGSRRSSRPSSRRSAGTAHLCTRMSRISGRASPRLNRSRRSSYTKGGRLASSCSGMTWQASRSAASRAYGHSPSSSCRTQSCRSRPPPFSTPVTSSRRAGVTGAGTCPGAACWSGCALGRRPGAGSTVTR